MPPEQNRNKITSALPSPSVPTEKIRRCPDLRVLRRQILATEVLTGLQGNLPANLHPLAHPLLSALIKNKAFNSASIKNLIIKSQNSSLSVNRLLGTLFDIKPADLEGYKNSLFSQLQLKPQIYDYRLESSFLPSRRVQMPENPDTDTQKNHALLIALLQILEVIGKRLNEHRELATSIPGQTEKPQALSPEIAHQVHLTRQFLQKKGDYNTAKLQQIVTASGGKLFPLLVALGIFPNAGAAMRNRRWLDIYYRLGLSPVNNDPFKPDHPLLKKMRPASANLLVRQKRALTNALLQILSHLEVCLIPPSKPVTAKRPPSSSGMITATKPNTVQTKTPETLKAPTTRPPTFIEKTQNETLKRNIAVFKRHFTAAKNYLTGKIFQGHLKTHFTTERSLTLVDFYQLTPAGIQVEDYLALVYKESHFKYQAKTASGKARGYFQLYGRAALREVQSKFGFNRIRGQTIDINNPMHNCVLGILYHKLILHQKTDFSRDNLNFSVPDRLKLARLMYNMGYGKLRRLIVNGKMKTYAAVESYLNEQLCKALGGCSGVITPPTNLNKQTGIRFQPLSGLVKYETVDAATRKNSIYIDLDDMTSSTDEPEEDDNAGTITFKASKLREALEYVRVISALENRATLPPSLITRPLNREAANPTPPQGRESPALSRAVTTRITKQIQKIADQIQPLLFKKLTLVRQIKLNEKEKNPRKKNIIAIYKQALVELETEIARLEKNMATIRSGLLQNNNYQPFLLRPGTGKGEQQNFEIAIAHKFNLPRVWSWQTVYELKKTGQLIPIIDPRTKLSANGYYTISPSAFGSDYKPYLTQKWQLSQTEAGQKLPELFANLHPSTKQFLDEFSTYYATAAHEKVKKALGATNCPPKPAPLLLGSALRTRLYQTNIQKNNRLASKKTSSHEFGHTFDISEKSFEKPGSFRAYYLALRGEMIAWVKNKEKAAYLAYRRDPKAAIKQGVTLVQYTAEVRGRRFHIMAYRPTP